MISTNCQLSNLPIRDQQLIKDENLLCADTGVVLTLETLVIWDNEYLSKEAYRARIETLDALADFNQEQTNVYQS